MAKKKNDEVETKVESEEAVETPAAVPEEAVVGDIKSQLIEVAKGVAITSADAGLVYLQASLDKVDFGRFKGTVLTLAKIGISELRNLLHGGAVSADAE